MLTGYLENLLNELNVNEKHFTILTPTNPSERGCQVSIYMKQNGKQVFNALTKAGVIADWREPNLPTGQAGVIRVAPVPLYNTFEDVFRFCEIFKRAIS
jgi:kynureninase